MIDRCIVAISQDSHLAPLSSRVAHGASHQDIRARSAAWKTDSVCSTEAGSRPGNVRKNRYKDVLPCKSRGFRGSPCGAAHAPTRWLSRVAIHCSALPRRPLPWLPFSRAAPECTSVAPLRGVPLPCWLSFRRLSGP